VEWETVGRAVEGGAKVLFKKVKSSRKTDSEDLEAG